MGNGKYLFGKDLFGRPIKQNMPGILKKRYLFPPFSVFDGRSGEWQKRKRAWKRLGIKSELGREEMMGRGDKAHGTYNIAFKEYASAGGVRKELKDSVSIFDPVLCEIIYRWFCPAGGQIVDPFAGGSVRGIVASEMGYKYWGCELRAEQVEANRQQSKDICDSNMPHWICGDSMAELHNAPPADFVFSCPPYGDLEKYSDDPRDLSNMDYYAFIAAYRRIVLKAVGVLKNDRYACFVVGDFRDKNGFMRGFVAETVKAFEAAGARLYNEALLVTPVGTASMRASKQFEVGRKLCKTHQNVLVFCKGDWRKATGLINQREVKWRKSRY